MQSNGSDWIHSGKDHLQGHTICVKFDVNYTLTQMKCEWKLFFTLLKRENSKKKIIMERTSIWKCLVLLRNVCEDHHPIMKKRIGMLNSLEEEINKIFYLIIIIISNAIFSGCFHWNDFVYGNGL